ncbi:MAG: hypothetical protein ACRDOH_17465 [Streptosporangiaceae bacterium]
MLGWVVGGVGTFALSLVFACWFLQLRCRGVGPPFGRHAKPWAILIVLGTAMVSTGLGLIVVAASHHAPAAYVGIIVPGGLWLTNVSPPRDRPGLLAAWLKRPLSRLYDGMGEDVQTWCDIRRTAAGEKPQWISDAAKYYYDQVEGRLKDGQAQARLCDWRDSIVHKISIVRLINLDTIPSRLQDSLQKHACTRNVRAYADDDLPRLARRLENDALNELNLFLALVYRLGYHKLLIYPFRPSAHRAPRSSTYEPGSRESGTTEPRPTGDVK